jgi:hypothetical protein
MQNISKLKVTKTGVSIGKKRYNGIDLLSLYRDEDQYMLKINTISNNSVVVQCNDAVSFCKFMISYITRHPEYCSVYVFWSPPDMCASLMYAIYIRTGMVEVQNYNNKRMDNFMSQTTYILSEHVQRETTRMKTKLCINVLYLDVLIRFE